jgi:UDP-N-acetyl-D-glucosamine/UDP-N-acetyl-D-galactosamine dehydrogenase
MTNALRSEPPRIAIIGLGYVGLPVALEFGKKFETVGFDIDKERVSGLARGEDATGEHTTEELAAAKRLNFTSDPRKISACNRFVVCVPTPITESREPDFSPLIGASNVVGKLLKKNDIVIYESTVYPGATEEVCVPVLEQVSGLKFNRDFFAGYSPERINPGDKQRPITSIKKVTSGSTPEVADIVDELYRAIITAGTHKAASIKVAEASKVIENIQRDLNIALMNELAQIFSRIGIDTVEVLEAAESKWNFVRVRPGLVGGHCISVDPYYLVKKSMTHGYVPDIIQTARKINEGMAEFAASKLIKAMIQHGQTISSANILVLGVTFKENCADIRNTKVKDLIENLKQYGAKVTIHDAWASDKDKTRLAANAVASELPDKVKYDAVVLAVAHDQYKALGAPALRSMLKPNGVLYDLKSVFRIGESDIRL